MTKYSHLNTHLPYGSHQTDSDDMNSVAQIIRSDFLTTGPAVANFEHALAEKTGASHVVACSSGTAALHMAALAIGLGEGDVAIVPSVTFLSTASAVRMVGAEVEFCDVDPYSGLMRPEDLKEALSRVPSGKAKAVFPVHFAGQIPDMENISAIARENGLHVVEDSCHSLGSTYKGSGEDIFQAGSCRHSDIAVFSFHPVKTITMGEGGAITTNNRKIYEKLLILRNNGIEKNSDNFINKNKSKGKKIDNPWYYEMQELGYHYRITDIQCALGLSQLKKINRFLIKRKNLAKRYDIELKNLKNCKLIHEGMRDNSSNHLYILNINFKKLGTTRGKLMKSFEEREIGTQVHYIPVPSHPYFKSKNYSKANLPNSYKYYEGALSIPLYYDLSKKQQSHVINQVKKLIG